MSEFIFMLTRNDATVPDALTVYREVRDTPLRYVGFKDVGLPAAQLRDLVGEIRADGREVMLEVVSERPEDELRAIETGLELGVDWLLGGTRVDAALALLSSGGPRYCPFPGRVIGHPSLLRGSIAEIADSARSLTSRQRVFGLDLLAYRYDGDVAELITAVVGASGGPVIAAGSVDSIERIRTVDRLGAWGFTIGGAIFDGRFPGAPSIKAQIEFVLAVDSATSQDAMTPKALDSATSSA